MMAFGPTQVCVYGVRQPEDAEEPLVGPFPPGDAVSHYSQFYVTQLSQSSVRHEYLSSNTVLMRPFLPRDTVSHTRNSVCSVGQSL